MFRIVLLFCTGVALLLNVGQAFASEIYWTDFATGSPNHTRVNRATFDGTDATTVVDASFNDVFRGIALDQVAGRMYVTNLGLGQIESYNFDGTGQSIPISGLSSPNGLALDLVNGKIYWTDVLKIQRANLNGTGVETLFAATGSDNFRAIALDLSGGKMYVANRGAARINRFNLDGTGVENLISSGLNTPFGLQLDFMAGKMYVTDGLKILRADLGGTGLETLVTATGSDNFRYIDLDPSAGKMYVANSGANRINRFNLDGTGGEDLIETDSAFGIAIVPEPSALILTGLGAVCLFIVRACRSRFSCQDSLNSVL